MKYLYRFYQLFIALPVGLVITAFFAIIIIIGCTLGNASFWANYAGRFWAWTLVRLFLLPVTVEGRENLEKNQSYVFCPNHQGAIDIFLVYGFLRRNFKWVMKKSLRNIPLIGKACESAEFIFIDKSGPSKIKESMDKAKHILKDGISVVIFPEGSRSHDGNMVAYKRGAFMMADELQLPVVPLTINGSFKAMSRHRDGKFVIWTPLRLTIHKPIYPIGQGAENQKYLSEESYKATKSALSN